MTTWAFTPQPEPPILAALEAEWHHDAEQAPDRATINAEPRSGYDQPNDPSQPQETAVSVLDDIRTDVDKALGNHAQAIEDALTTAAHVAASPLAQQVIALAHIPASVLEGFSQQLAALETEFARLAPAPVAAADVPAGDAPHPDTYVAQ